MSKTDGAVSFRGLLSFSDAADPELTHALYGMTKVPVVGHSFRLVNPALLTQAPL